MVPGSRGPTSPTEETSSSPSDLLVGGVHASPDNHDGGLGKVLGVGVSVTVPHTRHEQPSRKDGRPQHTEPTPWPPVLYEAGHLDHPLLPSVKCEAIGASKSLDTR